jgi:glycosyltransferase involved in cell wall biosynthesis
VERFRFTRRGNGMGVLASAKNKRLVLISHDLSQSGSPLLLVETAVRLREAGADVQLVTLAGDADGDSLAARHGIPVVPLAASFARCADADLVIANTAETASWIRSYLRDHPRSGRTLVWWIHEINARHYADQIPTFATVRALVFDSHASLNAWAATGLTFPSVVRVIHPCVDDSLLATALQSRYPYRNMDSLPSLPMRAVRRVYRRMGLSRWLPSRTGAYDRVTIRRRLGIEPNDYVVTLVGVYQTRKGHALLAETVGRMLEENPSLPLKLLLVGFSDVSQAQRFVTGVDSATRRALDPRRLVTVARNLAPYYAASDAFVMNSQGAGENFGRVTIEAMAFKLPVLGTNAGGTLEIVEDRVTGLLHRVGATGQEELAENIRVLARNRENGIAMGEAGYRRVRDRFTRPRFDAEFDGLLRDLLTDEPR